MNSKAFALFLALALTPLIASAQTQSSPAPAAPAAPATVPAPAGPMEMQMEMSPAQRQAHMQAMRAFRQQAEHLHRATRAKMLAALTAAHRALLARVVGNLAIAANPDPRAAARTLDAAISSGERQAVLNAQRSEMSQMHALMEQMRTQMENSLTPAQRAQMQSHMIEMHGHGMMTGMMMDDMGMHHHGRHASDAGFILLHSLMPGHENMFFVTTHGADHP
ncbi:MAG TPA: hypothetical protein VIN40_06730 [Candidatus Tyrphobacter sp.]